ncbi:FAD-binding protein [Chloroflexota bacterium]
MELKSLLPERWDNEADVVIVGYGAAGAATAITVHDAGGVALILEKAPEGEAGGNSRVAGQFWLNLAPIDRAITYFDAMAGPYTVSPEVVRVWAEEMGKNSDWVRSIGGEPVEMRTGPEGAAFPELPGADCVHLCHVGPQHGYEGLWKVLKAAVDKRHVQILYATPGRELIQHGLTKEILGVRAEREGKPINIKAKRAVVLTCGGFENNQEMVRDFLPGLPYCYPLGTPYNTGDGIKMAMTVGADLWHMNNIAGPWYSLKVPEFPSIFEIAPLSWAAESRGGLILVGPDGKRFIDEKKRQTHGKVMVSGQWTQDWTPYPMFMIFDDVLLSAGPLYNKNLYHGWNEILNVYPWSADNSVELAKGWIKKAETIAELAGKLGLSPTILEDTVNRWNAYYRDEKDLDFGRTKMFSPIKGPPFYAMEMSPFFVNTQGGPRRNARGQIVRPDGSPISRLYSAGELGSVYSFLYNAGGNLGECMVFGRISGRNALAERAWR